MSVDNETASREIDGFLYEVDPLGAKEGQKALLRFLKMAGPILQRLPKKEKASPEDIINASSSLFGSLGNLLAEDDLEYFCEKFGMKTKFSKVGAEVDSDGNIAGRLVLVLAQQDKHFSARYMEMFEWLKFCCEVNFGGFFSKAMSRVQAMKSPTTASLSIQMSGSSSES